MFGVKMNEKKNEVKEIPLEELQGLLAEVNREKKEVHSQLKPLMERWEELVEHSEILEEELRERLKREAIENGRVSVLPRSCKDPVKWREKKEKLEKLMGELGSALIAGDEEKVRELQAQIVEVSKIRA